MPTSPCVLAFQHICNTLPVCSPAVCWFACLRASCLPICLLNKSACLLVCVRGCVAACLLGCPWWYLCSNQRRVTRLDGYKSVCASSNRWRSWMETVNRRPIETTSNRLKPYICTQTHACIHNVYSIIHAYTCICIDG